MDHRHNNEDEKKKRGGRRGFRGTEQGSKIEDTPPSENDKEKSGIKVLSATKRPRHDRPFPQGQVGMDRHGQMLVGESGRQSRDHLFKECRTWKGEIRELWSAVGKISGKRESREGMDETFKSRKGFGFHVRQARARPSNTTVRELLSNNRYTEAVLDFLGKTRVGEVKEGVICK